jgi:superkiller protein 3
VIYGGQSGDELESLANQALQSGIDKYTDGDYKGAVTKFKRALGLSPYSNYTVDTTKYLAQSYLQLDQTEKAIDAYKQGLEINSQSDELYLELGNLYLAEGQNSKAIEAYEQAVRIYDDSTNRYSLGEAYLFTGRYKDAETQFEKVIQYDSSSYSGYYGLG